MAQLVVVLLCLILGWAALWVLIRLDQWLSRFSWASTLRDWVDLVWSIWFWS